MKAKKLTTLLGAVALAASMLAGCGGDQTASSAPESSQAVSSQEISSSETAPSSEASSEAESSGESAAPASTDPLEMITEGYYSVIYPVDGMDDMCAFFHFYPEQPVLGSVFYAGFAWNQITYVGTYTVEKIDCPYSCFATRQDSLDDSGDGAKKTAGTAPYTVTFTDFDGKELGKCGYDGDVLYNDCAVTGTGGENMYFLHDVDPESKGKATYEGEKGIAYMSFVAEDPTSTLAIYHNGRYEDMVNMMVEGTWQMEESADGLKFNLTPDSDIDTPATLTVSADHATAEYAPKDGEAVAMSNPKLSGPVATMVLKGQTPIPGQDVQADIIGSMYEDGTVTLVASAFGTEIPLDQGTYVAADNGYEFTFTFETAGEIKSGLGEAGAVMQYKAASEMLGDIDTELVISMPE